MKKKLFAAGLIGVLCLSSALALSGCGEKQPYSDYDLSEYVKVGEYKGLEYKKVTPSVSEKEVQEEIDSRLKSHAKTEEVKEGTVEDGDTLNIDFVGKIDGKTFDGGSGEGQSLTIGSGTFIDGFETGLIGKNIGDKVSLDLTFPKDYGKDSEGKVLDEDKAKLAEKPVTFEVTINSKQVEKVPEYNMDFVKEYYSSYDSLEAFEKGVKKDLLAKKTDEADMNMKQELWEQIVQNSKAKKYPEEEKKAFIEKEKKAQKAAAEGYGMEWDAYLDAIGYTEEEFNKQIETYAESYLLQEMIAYTIADKEGIEVSDDDYEKYLDTLLETAGMTEDTFKDAYGMSVEEYGEEKNMRFSVLLNQVMDKVMEYGKVKK
ncbi:MAG: trigger factor [Emergencia sp.]|nr:trigger factor [Emergencia sp.]